MPHLRFSRKIRSSVNRTAFLVLAIALPAAGQAPPPAADLKAHIANLASIDYPTRMNAARMVRRADAAVAVAALREAIATSKDEFVRYRAFVLLSSFGDRQTGDLVRSLLRDRNDRVRESAYKWLELHPDPAMTATLLASLQTEQAEFVRPALVGAIAALGQNAQVQKALIAETTRGVDFFRAAVIDSLGRHRGAYAVEVIAGVAALEGPLQDDAVLALGRIGDARARAALATFKTATAVLLPTIRAAQCLAGAGCEATIAALVEMSTTPGTAPAAVRAAVNGLAAIAGNGHAGATSALVDLARRGGGLRDAAALGLGAAAVRNPPHVIGWLDAAPAAARDAAVDLLKVGFEDLEEDFGEEQFFAAARASYWKAAEGSASRTLAAALIQKLEF